MDGINYWDGNAPDGFIYRSYSDTSLFSYYMRAYVGTFNATFHSRACVVVGTGV